MGYVIAKIDQKIIKIGQADANISVLIAIQQAQKVRALGHTNNPGTHCMFFHCFPIQSEQKCLYAIPMYNKIIYKTIKILKQHFTM